MSKYITIKNVADKAHVSVATASRALSGKGIVHESTRKRVQDVARSLGYVPSEVAVNLRAGCRKVVGLILPDMLGSFFYEITLGISNVLRKNGWSYILTFSDDDTKRESECIESLLKQKVDGIIMCASSAQDENEELIQSTIDKGIPFVFILNKPYAIKATSIVVNIEDALFYFTENLIRKYQYKKIALVIPPLRYRYAVPRFNGYKMAMQRYNLYNSNFVFECQGMRISDGKNIADKIAEQLNEIEAIIACDDQVALGIMWEFQRKGINIPQSVAIAGIGGSYLNEAVFPTLTSIEYPKKEIGMEAARKIIDMVELNKKELCTTTILPDTIYRETTPPRN